MKEASAAAGVRGGSLVDYHTHPMRASYILPVAEHKVHFRASMDSYVARATELGLDEIGFSEHVYRLSIAPDVVPWKQNARGDIGSYVEVVETVKDEQARKRAAGEASPLVRLSMEVDIVPSTVSILQAALPLYSFDYLLGSVHEVPDLPEGAGAEEAYTGYYATMQWGAHSGLFHSIAHPDRVHRKLGPVDASFLRDLMAETARVLASAGICVELSANGVRAGTIGLDPNEQFMRLCYEHGVPISLGSDAHKVEVIGVGLPEACAFARQIGYREVATFEGGRRMMRPLPGMAPIATHGVLKQPAAAATR